MRLGFIGLGRMGRAMVSRLLREGVEVVVFDLDKGAVAEAQKAGALAGSSAREVVSLVSPPRIIWLMVPAGNPVDEVLWGKEGIVVALTRGDIVVDGGNSHFRDSMRRAEQLSGSGISFLDAGCSGGIEGAEEGLSITVGGEATAFRKCEGIFRALAAEGGYGRVGGAGAGHFVKMAHNAIEYGVLQVLGEGFWLLERSELKIDKSQAARIWNRGSVIRSWLLELCERILARPAELEGLADYVGGGSTGEWAIDEARRLRVPMPLINLAYLERVRSWSDESFAAKLVAALRHEFGGHEVRRKK